VQLRKIEMTEESKQTYDLICFTDLAYEFNFSDKKEIEEAPQGSQARRLQSRPSRLSASTKK
jgi:hypothetical protein